MNFLTLWFHKMGSPPTFYRIAGRLLPWLYVATLALGAWGMYDGLFLAPADYQQGDSYRITLVTGSLWGKPMWGTWWTWDARLTSELVLLFLYLGVLGLYNAIEDKRQAARAAAFLALIGVVNVPIVHFSVQWWNTLHQGSTVRLFGPSHIDASMLAPLLLMAAATHLCFFASLLARSRVALIELESGKDWVRQLVHSSDPNAGEIFEERGNV